MNLQTKIPLRKESKNLIEYNSKILLLGSCFSENIGDKLNYYKFQTSVNPFGIFFHPKAIEHFVLKVTQKTEFTFEDLIFQNERWHCFDAHSNLSNSDKKEILNNLNSTIITTNNYLQKTSHIIITLGTSWVYKFIKTEQIVANCHKIPQNRFKKELLSVNEIYKSLENIILLLKSINKDLHIVFTVSPIRHLKDGFIENTRSKAHLISGIHQALEHKNTSYFPSYEIMMDELRDYRFYSEDMIHPNKTAINYIWEQFVACWFSEESKNTMQEIETIQKGISHRPFNKSSNQHEQFLKNLEIKKSKLLEKFPFLKF